MQIRLQNTPDPVGICKQISLLNLCCIPTKCPSRAVGLGALVVAVITWSISLPRFISAKRIQSVALCSSLTDLDQNALRRLLVSSYVGWVKHGPCPSTKCKCSHVTWPGKVRAQPYGTMSEHNQTTSKAGAWLVNQGLKSSLDRLLSTDLPQGMQQVQICHKACNIVLKYRNKILLHEMKFLVPNYSCLQNPWLGGYCPQILILSVLNWICWTPPLNRIPGYATA